MTEKQKMLSGATYNSRDPELLEMYHYCRTSLQTFNQIKSQEQAQKSLILEKLLGGIGANVWIEAPFYCDYGEFIFIGHNSFINVNCVFVDNNTIMIGDNCLIGPAVQFYTASHPLPATYRIQKETNGKTSYQTCSRPIKIGNNAWIGGNSVILPGVTIGDNTTIGAGSVVSRDIPANVLAVGNPCEIIGNI